MLAAMNAEALRLTRETGRAHYWSRSRGKLWRKGETSGNEQLVQGIFVNCEQNSLLLQVRQVGAVCHHGFPSCFYRRVEEDDALTVVRDREFDPTAVYGSAAEAEAVRAAQREEIDALAEATRRLYAAYAYLRDHDLATESGTSRRLRDAGADVRPRVADELRELAGVLAGDHQHANLVSDLVLEASQVVYWVVLSALREDVTWARLRPDRALATGDADLSRTTIVRLLRADADSWVSELPVDLAARSHATLALVGQACRVGGVEPLEVIEYDLAELRARPYLAPFFSGERG
jgi:hypothetical protein